MILINSKGKEQTKKRTFGINMWYDQYDWLISYIPWPVKNRGWC